MLKEKSLVRPLKATARLGLIFAMTVLAPGVILTYFSVRTLIEQRRLTDQQIQSRLDAVVENAGRRLELEFRNWQEDAETLARVDLPSNERWPERVRGLAASGMGVALAGRPENPETFPVGQLLFDLSSVSDVVRAAHTSPMTEMTRAETLELRDKRYDEAAAIYRRMLVSASSANRAFVLHRLARTLKKGGKTEEAIVTFQQLEEQPSTRLGALPSDLLALYEVASLVPGPERSDDALRLYRGLVEGRWRLSKASYLFYSQTAREWIPDNEETRRLAAEEQQKLALTKAVASFLADPRSLSLHEDGPFIAFFRQKPFGAIVLGERFLRERLVASIENAEFDFSFVKAGGTPSAVYALQESGFPLRLHAWPKDPAALDAGLKRQQNLYLGMLTVVAALLAFGTYLTVRMLRSELRVAQMKSDFVSTVSHEFRSPLAGINQLGEMLRDGRVRDPGRQQEYYEMIVAETHRLRRLVENILDFARMEDGRKEYRLEPFSAAAWLREVTADFQAQIASRGFQLEAVIPAELPEIAGDRNTLTTALHNLLDNAVKYSGNTKLIQCEARANASSLSISVRDWGMGIPDEDRPRVFEKFYRGRIAIARQTKGAGLGLNLVRHIVAAHGGAIDFESKEGEGSTFTIHLNVRRNQS